MDYFDTLRRDGWLADPGERVRVVAVHRDACLTRRGRPCSCRPRLGLAAEAVSLEAGDFDDDLPTFDLASGE